MFWKNVFKSAIRISNIYYVVDNFYTPYSKQRHFFRTLKDAILTTGQQVCYQEYIDRKSNKGPIRALIFNSKTGTAHDYAIVTIDSKYPLVGFSVMNYHTGKRTTYRNRCYYNTWVKELTHKRILDSVIYEEGFPYMKSEKFTKPLYFYLS